MSTVSATEQDIDEFSVLNSLLSNRWSCRGFQSEPAPRPTIERLLSAAQRAPSWSNMQPWQVCVVSGAAIEKLTQDMAASTAPRGPDFAFPKEFEGVYGERRRASGWQLYEAVGVARGDRERSAAQAARNFEFFGAPHTAVITTERKLGVYGALDCGLYVQTFLLAAQALGLGAVAQAAPASRAAFLRTWLGLPESRAVLCVISFGYADIEHSTASFRTERAPLEEVVTFIDDPEDRA